MSEVAMKIPRLITLVKASEASGIPLSSLRRYAKDKKFPSHKIASALYVDVADFNDWIESTKKVSA